MWRSDERDFVDDMLDDVAGAPAVMGVTAAPGEEGIVVGSGSADLLAKQQANTAKQMASLGYDPLFNPPPTVAQSRAQGQADIAAGKVGPSVPFTPGVFTSTIATPGSAPHLETPPVAVNAIPGEEGQVLGGLASAVRSVTDPRLRQIIGSIRAMRVQSQATSEHAALSAQTQFRRDVTARLARIESRLPAGSLRSQVSTVRARILPLLLG